MDKPIDAATKDRDALQAELEAAGAVFKGKICRCPFHDDKSPSAGLYQGESGTWRFKCHSGSCGFSGDIFDVRAEITNRTREEVLRDFLATQAPQRREPDPPKEILSYDDILRRHGKVGVKVFVYTNHQTRAIDFITARIDKPKGKMFVPYRPEGGGFVAAFPSPPRPIYNRSRLTTAGQIVVVEGEKCVHALHRLEIVGTTSPGGCKSAHLADWSLLAGKNVTVWPDNDDGGVGYGEAVVDILSRLDPPPSISWVDPASLGLGPATDVADYVQTLADLPKPHQRESVLQVITTAQRLGTARELEDFMRDTISGKRRAIDWPWSMTSKFSKALFPGTITLICGEGGASKTFMVLQAAMYWHEKATKVALYELEGKRSEHMNRVLAQTVGEANLTDDEWLRSHGQAAMDLTNEYMPRIASFGDCICTMPEEPPSLDDLILWVASRVATDTKIIIIDPITLATGGEKPWVADKKFLIKLRRTVEGTDSRVVIVIHPKKGHSGSDLSDLAGGAAWARHCETVLWLEGHEPPASGTVQTVIGSVQCTFNRSLRILKARHGRGTGARMAFTFARESLTFNEHGIVQKKQKQQPEADESNWADRKDLA